MDAMNESSDELDKEAMDVNPCETSDKEEIDNMKEIFNESEKQTMDVNSSDIEEIDYMKESSNVSNKHVTDVYPREPSDKEEMDIMNESCNESDKQTTDYNSCESSDKNAMDVGSNQLSNKVPISPSNEHEKDKGQRQMKPEDNYKKLQSMKRTFKEISSSEYESPMHSVSAADSLPAKKLLLENSRSTVISFSAKDSVNVENKPDTSLHKTSVCHLNQSLTSPQSFSSSKSQDPSISQPSTSVSALPDPSITHQYSVGENTRKLCSSGGRFYSTRTQKLYSVYISGTEMYEEVRNPRCLYSNKYKSNLGLKYFVYPLSHILMKDILDFVDFFNGTDAYIIPENLDSLNPVFSPDEWKLQFVRPYFEVGIIQMEALTLDQLEMEFDKLVLEKLFGPESNNKLDHTFFLGGQTAESQKINLEYTFQPSLAAAKIEYLVVNLKLYNDKTEIYFMFMCRCLIGLLKHINFCRNESVHISCSRFTMDIFWMLRKLADLRKVIIRLLKMESYKNSYLSTTYILKVKFHALMYFNDLLLRLLKIIKKCRSES